MHGRRTLGSCGHCRGIARAHVDPLLDAPADRQVAVDQIVRGSLVGDGVRPNAATDHLGHELRCIAEHGDGDRAARGFRVLDHLQRRIERRRLRVDIACVEPLLDAALLTFDAQDARARHRRCKRLRAAHAAEPCRQNPLAVELAAEVAPSHLDERLVRALHDALAADVDPRAGSHLAEHHQAATVELVEVLPRRPLRHEIRIREQHARRIFVRAEHADRLAGLNQQRFVGVERAQRLDDAIEAFPVARGAADAAVHDQLVGILRDLGVEIVHQHA